MTSPNERKSLSFFCELYSGGIITKLWTNSNSSRSFSAQTVSLDLTEYQSVFIVFRRVYDNDSGNRLFRFCNKEASVLMKCSWTGTVRQRTASVSDDGVTFTLGKTGSSNDNNVVIPTEIYGVPADAGAIVSIFTTYNAS